MKKKLTLMLSIFLILSLCGCTSFIHSGLVLKENTCEKKDSRELDENDTKIKKRITTFLSKIIPTKKASNIPVNPQNYTSEREWYFIPRKDGAPPKAESEELVSMLKKYSAYYLGDTTKKVLYLTFDEGYENGYTDKILDILKNNNVKAAFFVTKPYITSNKELVKRMLNEGHLVCNHSNKHKSMAYVAMRGKAFFDSEFSITEKAYEEVTGAKMPKFFRPPMGKYSEKSLQLTKELGYKTIFWSFAYNDWERYNQPNPEHAKKIIMERTHNGCIILLHAVSKTNEQIMDEIIKEWKNKGYEFKTLNELP